MNSGPQANISNISLCVCSFDLKLLMLLTLVLTSNAEKNIVVFIITIKFYIIRNVIAALFNLHYSILIKIFLPKNLQSSFSHHLSCLNPEIKLVYCDDLFLVITSEPQKEQASSPDVNGTTHNDFFSVGAVILCFCC